MIHSSILLTEINELTEHQKAIVLALVKELRKITTPVESQNSNSELFTKVPFSLFPDIRPDDDRLIRFLSILWQEDDPLHANWDELAYKEKLSLSRLNVICRAETSYTVQKVSELFAIEKCKNDLINHKMSILEIGRNRGFENPSHFAKKFREIVGVSPRIYRRQIKECSNSSENQQQQNN